MDRIRFLDGLRGVAISEVVLYHGFTHYVSSYPFGDAYANIPLFRFGFIGVELFFMISGFVIFMTLKRCHNVMDFLTRRWLRLFPAMLIGALLIYGSAHLAPTVFVYRPSGMPVASQLAPSLLLLDPSIIQALTGVTVGQIEGSLWSIFVELKFYAFIGLAFFLFGEIPSLILLYTLSLASCALAYFDCWSAFSALNRMGIVFFPWFAIGVLAFKYFETRKRALLLLIAPMFLCSLYILKLDHRNDGYVCVIYQVINAVLFLGPVALAALRPLLAWRAPVFIGFVSYPLYLVHENMLVAVTAFAERATGNLALALTLGFATVLAAATLIAFYGEPLTRQFLQPAYERLRYGLGAIKPETPS